MTQTVTDAAVAPPALRRRRRLPRMQELGLVIVILLLYGGLTLAGHAYRVANVWNLFLNLDNQVNGIGGQMSIYCIMAVGMTAVIITGGIDISVASILALSGIAGANIVQYMDPHTAWYIAIPVTFGLPILIGGLCGLANGAMVVGFRMHPFIVTLATYSILRGLCPKFPSTVPIPGRQLPDAFINFMGYRFGADIQLMPVIIMLVVVILGAIFLHTTTAGRETYAVGGNPEAARYSGIRVWWVLLRVYILMGICSGIAAVVMLGRWNTMSTNDALGYELDVIAAAVVGGASLLGGRGTALGALLGTGVIALIDNGIYILHWHTDNTKIIVGAAIVVAVGIDRISDHFFRRRAA